MPKDSEYDRKRPLTDKELQDIVDASDFSDSDVVSLTSILQLDRPLVENQKISQQKGKRAYCSLSPTAKKRMISEVGALRLDTASILMPALPTAKLTSPGNLKYSNIPPADLGATQSTPDIYQLCVCESGKLFLASPHLVCASENDDRIWLLLEKHNCKLPAVAQNLQTCIIRGAV
nr:unnamed protein product [Callosobruchus chinensis]